jgi:hypothetical protein
LGCQGDAQRVRDCESRVGAPSQCAMAAVHFGLPVCVSRHHVHGMSLDGRNLVLIANDELNADGGHKCTLSRCGTCRP